MNHLEIIKSAAIVRDFARARQVINSGGRAVIDKAKQMFTGGPRGFKAHSAQMAGTSGALAGTAAGWTMPILESSAVPGVAAGVAPVAGAAVGLTAPIVAAGVRGSVGRTARIIKARKRLGRIRSMKKHGHLDIIKVASRISRIKRVAKAFTKGTVEGLEKAPYLSTLPAQIGVGAGVGLARAGHAGAGVAIGALGAMGSAGQGIYRASEQVNKIRRASARLKKMKAKGLFS